MRECERVSGGCKEAGFSSVIRIFLDADCKLIVAA